MLGADVGMLECLGLLSGEGEHLLHARRVGNIPRHLVLLSGANLFLDLLADGLQIEAHLLEDIHGNSLAKLDQTEQQMFRADIIMVKAVCLLAGECQNLLSARREVIHHDSSLVVVLDVGGVVGIFPISGSCICFNFARISAARKESRSSEPSFTAWSPFWRWAG